MSAGPRRSERVTRSSVADRDGYNLSTELTKKTQNLIAKNTKEYTDYPINDDDWVVFFCDYLDFIQNNIDPCLTKIKGLQHMTASDFYKVDLSGGGFDSDFDDFDKLNYNVGLYEALFTQFKDGTNKINNCARLNQLLSYIGAAVLRMSAHYNQTSANALIEFYRKIAFILELSVYPEIFLQFITGDSTGNKESVDLKKHNPAKHAIYKGVWIRKQEFLGVIAGSGKNYWKKYDNGLRLFVRNYIRRLITYMRTYNTTYPLGYELPYNYSANPNRVLKNPLPPEGVYKYSAPPENYYISRDDWKHIPNLLLPHDALWDIFPKNYINPENWNHPPPLWWIERTVAFFRGTEWWNARDTVIEAISAQLSGTIEYRKWLAINCILPQQYDSYSELWDAEYVEPAGAAGAAAGPVGDAYMGFGGISKMNKTAKAATAAKAKKNKINMTGIVAPFKIIQDRDRTINPNIYNELKSKLKDYFKLNVVVVKPVAVRTAAHHTESHLRDDVYIDNLSNYSMLYNPRTHKMNKNNVSASATYKKRAQTV